VSSVIASVTWRREFVGLTSARETLWTWKLNERLHATEKRGRGWLLQSPLADSNRRSPSHHGRGLPCRRKSPKGPRPSSRRAHITVGGAERWARFLHLSFRSSVSAGQRSAEADGNNVELPRPAGIPTQAATSRFVRHHWGWSIDMRRRWRSMDSWTGWRSASSSGGDVAWRQEASNSGRHPTGLSFRECPWRRPPSERCEAARITGARCQAAR